MTDPPERGAEAPDWFYVPNVPPLLDGQMRRSYVIWKEIIAPFYAIYDVQRAAVDVYELVANQYQPCRPNERGHYPVLPMGVELGIWQGRYGNQTLPWLRWWDSEGHLLLSSDERAEQERQRADQEQQRREQLEVFLRSQGFDPDRLPHL